MSELNPSICNPLGSAYPTCFELSTFPVSSWYLFQETGYWYLFQETGFTCVYVLSLSPTLFQVLWTQELENCIPYVIGLIDDLTQSNQ